MPYYPGHTAYLLVGGTDLPPTAAQSMGKYGIKNRADRAEMNDIRQRTLRTLGGIESCELVFDGPFTGLSFTAGDEIRVALGLGGVLWLTLQVRVESVEVEGQVRGAFHGSVTAVVTDDFVEGPRVLTFEAPT